MVADGTREQLLPSVAKINKSTIDGLNASGNSPAFVWDSQIPGFGVKALPSGKKRYVFKYRSGGGGRSGTQRWLMLGTHGAITVDEARKLAQQASAAVARGVDPQSEKENLRAQARMKDVWQRFERDYLPHRKPSTGYSYKKLWDDVLAVEFGNKAVRDVSRGDVDRFHKKLSETPYQANRILALLSRLMSLAEAWELRPQGTNPCRYVQRFKEVARTRYLSSAELEAIGQALTKLTERKQERRDGELAANGKPKTSAGAGLDGIRAEDANAIRLLLFTGARLNELLTAKLEWIDWERRVIALPDSKTGKKPLYLSDAAVAVLREQQIHAAEKKSEYVFPGRSKTKHMINLRKPWMAVCKEAGVSGVRLHDLRHTAASVAVGQGVPLTIIGRLLGHTQAQTTLRYAHVDADPALAAANKIGEALSGRISA